MMAEPNEADRAKATGVWTSIVHRYDGRGGITVLHVRLTEVIAQALADERERARAPFLAVLGEHQPTPAEDEFAGQRYPRDMCTCGESFHDDCEIRLALRRAAEETGQ